MKRMLALLLLMVCCVLTGCMSRQLEEQMLVIILGVDETEDGIRLVLKIPSNSASGDSGGDNTSGEDDAMSGGGQMGYLLLEATGGSFEDTMTLLHATTPRTLNFCQVREVVVGEKLASIARTRQVIAITHQAQLAALADAQYLVEKRERDGSVFTSVRRLNEEERVSELSRIMGGDDEASLNHARSMLSSARQRRAELDEVT